MGKELLDVVSALREYLLYGSPVARAELVAVLDMVANSQKKEEPVEIPHVTVVHPDGRVVSIPLNKLSGDPANTRLQHLVQYLHDERYTTRIEEPGGTALAVTAGPNVRLSPGDKVYLAPRIVCGSTTPSAKRETKQERSKEWEDDDEF